MKLNVVIEELNYGIDVPPAMLTEADDFFRKIDTDMDQGWQMGTEYIEQPTTEQRCQIVANKLLTSHASQNVLLVQLMAAYILKRLPGVVSVSIETGGDMQGTEFGFGHGPSAAKRGPAAALTPEAARAKADQDVSPVYKIGKSWRFAVYDGGQDRWLESPFTSTEAEAQQQRDAAHADMVRRLSAG